MVVSGGHLMPRLAPSDLPFVTGHPRGLFLFVTCNLTVIQRPNNATEVAKKNYFLPTSPPEADQPRAEVGLLLIGNAIEMAGKKFSVAFFLLPSFSIRNL